MEKITGEDCRAFFTNFSQQVKYYYVIHKHKYLIFLSHGIKTTLNLLWHVNIKILSLYTEHIAFYVRHKINHYICKPLVVYQF